MARALDSAKFHAEMKHPKPGAYLLWGEEGFMKRRELNSLREKICSDESISAFNHFVFTRDNYSPEALSAAIESPAMMSDLKLVELYCLPLAEYRKKEDTEVIESALKNAAGSADTLMIVYTTPENFDPGDPKAPSAWMKLFSKCATTVEYKHEPTPKLVSWVQKHFTAEKLVAEVNECAYLIDSVGHDMSTLVGEIEKLICYLKSKEREKLEKCDIDLICPKNKEIGSFDFADAILDANSDKAYYVLAEMRRTNEPAQIVLGGITKIYLDLLTLKIYAEAGVTSDEAAKRMGIHPYVAKLRMGKARSCDRRAIEEVIDLCAEADAAMKSNGIDEYVLLERLIAQTSQLRKRRIF